VEYSNQLDPATPAGLVGGQMPSAFGGYDYAKLMRKVHFLEATTSLSQAIIRSFIRTTPCPLSPLFTSPVEDDLWQTWILLAHGNRGTSDGWRNGSRADAPAVHEPSHRLARSWERRSVRS